MSDMFFFGMLAVMVPALFAVMYFVVGIVADEFRAGRRRLGLAMIAAVAVIVGAALPWYLL